MHDGWHQWVRGRSQSYTWWLVFSSRGFFLVVSLFALGIFLKYCIENLYLYICWNKYLGIPVVNSIQWLICNSLVLINCHFLSSTVNRAIWKLSLAVSKVSLVCTGPILGATFDIWWWWFWGWWWCWRLPLTIKIPYTAYTWWCKTFSESAIHTARWCKTFSAIHTARTTCWRHDPNNTAGTLCPNNTAISRPSDPTRATLWDYWCSEYTRITVNKW